METHPFVVEHLTPLLVHSRARSTHKSSGAFVHDLDQFRGGSQGARGGDGEAANLEELLAVEEHARVEVWHEVRERVRGRGVVGGDDAEGGEDVELGVAFEYQGEIGARDAEGEGVEDGFDVGVGVDAGLAFQLEGLLDLRDVLAVVA